VGSANRQGAKKVTQIEILPEPPRERTDNEPWPLWPKLLKTSSSHEEGCERLWNIQTKQFIEENGAVKKVEAVRVQWRNDGSGRQVMTELPGTAFEIEAELVLIAMGFEHVIHEGPVNDLGLALDGRGNISVDENFMTGIDGVFAAGDAHRGASLVVWAIQEGRMAAAGIMSYLRNRQKSAVSARS